MRTITLDTGDSAVWSVGFASTCEQAVASARNGDPFDNDHRIYRIDLETGSVQQTYAGHSATIWRVRYGPQNRHVASGASDEKLIVWNAASGEPLVTRRVPDGRIKSLAFSPDGSGIATGGRRLRIWDTLNGPVPRDLGEHAAGKEIESVNYASSGASLVTGGFDGTVRLWDVSAV